MKPKHRRFIDEYFANGFNATRAAIKAGYSERSARSTASEILTYPDVKAEVERLLEAYSMPTKEILARLSHHARGDMREFIGLTYSDLKYHPDGSLIKEVERTITRLHKDDKSEVVEESFRIKLYDAQAAMNALWRYNQIAEGKATENIDVTDAKERLAQLLTRQSEREPAADDSGGAE